MARKKSKRSSFRGKVSADSKKQQTRGAQYGYLNLPRGVSLFKEPSSGRVRLDFLPYEVTDPKHPDRDDELGIAVPGELWYKRPFKVHRGVGAGMGDTMVCPTSIGKKCPICEYRAKRIKEGAPTEETKAMRPSLRNLYVVVPIDVKDYEEKPHIWNISQFLFQEKLNEELEENEDAEVFPDLEEGLTLRIRFSAQTIGKSEPFAETSRIDFEERDKPYDESILDEVPNLDEVLIIPSYKELQRKFFEIDDEDMDGDDEEIPDGLKTDEELEEERERSTRRSRRTARREPEPESEPEDDIPFDPDPEEDEKPSKPSGRKRSKRAQDDDVEEEKPRKRGRRKRTEPEPEEDDGPDEPSDDRCPFGYRFGQEPDEHDECDKCDVWDECMDLKEELEGK